MARQSKQFCTKLMQ